VDIATKLKTDAIDGQEFKNEKTSWFYPNRIDHGYRDLRNPVGLCPT